MICSLLKLPVVKLGGWVLVVVRSVVLMMLVVQVPTVSIYAICHCLDGETVLEMIWQVRMVLVLVLGELLLLAGMA